MNIKDKIEDQIVKAAPAVDFSWDIGRTVALVLFIGGIFYLLSLVL